MTRTQTRINVSVRRSVTESKLGNRALSDAWYSADRYPTQKRPRQTVEIRMRGIEVGGVGAGGMFLLVASLTRNRLSMVERVVNECSQPVEMQRN